MIGRLEGVVVEREDNGSCVIDVRGVGYEVFVPGRSLQKLPTAPEKAILHIHTHVREDAITLYGFATRTDRLAFQTLLSVSGVGPKLALTILHHLTASDLAMAIAREDKSRFKGISGVGKKVAERLVIDLRDKLPVIAPAAAVSSGSAPAAALNLSDNASTVISALIQMGFSRAESERAVAEAKGRDRELQVEELLREALSKLA